MNSRNWITLVPPSSELYTTNTTGPLYSPAPSSRKLQMQQDPNQNMQHEILQSLFGVLDHLRRSQVAVEHHIAYFQGQTPPGLPPLGYVQPPPHSGYNGLPLPTTDPNTLARKRGPRGADEEDDGTGKRKRRRGPAGKEKKNEVRKEMQAQFPNTPYHEVLSKISERWAKMTDEEKKYYNDQTDIAKKKFTADKAAYDAKRQGQNGTAPLVETPGNTETNPAASEEDEESDEEDDGSEGSKSEGGEKHEEDSEDEDEEDHAAKKSKQESNTSKPKTEKKKDSSKTKSG
ncbi:non-histone chromosomal 6 [Pyrrhoderma noxium]|uniref:Non-histone chromosomal 6 n=1 Tax=Pyrrhoderma noxium TaxID=2282107 RepID=A0A286ULR5_9AGAM|nr:non-histone chromosomal 6 [Pyrrhoderma noxium]